jgi:hypothetical protein
MHGKSIILPLISHRSDSRVFKTSSSYARGHALAILTLTSGLPHKIRSPDPGQRFISIPPLSDVELLNYLPSLNSPRSWKATGIGTSTKTQRDSTMTDLSTTSQAIASLEETTQATVPIIIGVSTLSLLSISSFGEYQTPAPPNSKSSRLAVLRTQKQCKKKLSWPLRWVTVLHVAFTLQSTRMTPL